MKLKILISGRKTRITNQVSEITQNAVINAESNNDVCSDPDCDITGLETHEELFHEIHFILTCVFYVLDGFQFPILIEFKCQLDLKGSSYVHIIYI